MEHEKTPEKKSSKVQTLEVELEQNAKTAGRTKDSVVTLDDLSSLLNIDSRS